MENCLLIDTSVENGFVAFAVDNKIIFETALGGTFDSAQNLISILKQQLDERAINLSSIQAFAVCVGPGSYTGLRIGVIVAKSFAYVFKKPLIGIPSVELYAPLILNEKPFIIVLDAKMGGVYAAIGETYHESLKYSDPFIISLDELPKKLIGLSCWISPHAMRLKERCALLRSFEGHEIYSSPRLMLMAALKKRKNNDFSLDQTLEILYLKRSQAEYEREKNQQSS